MKVTIYLPLHSSFTQYTLSGRDELHKDIRKIHNENLKIIILTFYM